MDKKKLMIFEKHKTMLEIIVHLGGGLMFVSHLLLLMKYKNKTQIWRDINELIKSGLLEKIKYHRHSVIKVKAFPLKLILEKQKVNSVVVTGYQIMKSAMICSIILKSYEQACAMPEEFLFKVKNHSNFYYPNDHDLYLYKQLRQSFLNQDMYTENLDKEIARISKVVPAERYKLTNSKNLNTYIEKYGYKKNSNDFIIGIAILNLASEFIPRNIANRIADVFAYYDRVFVNNLNVVGRKRIHYIFTIYAQDANRLKYLQKQLQKIKVYLASSNHDMNRITFILYDLKLTSTVFSNQKIIL